MPHQQVADELGGNLLGGAAEEGAWEVYGGAWWLWEWFGEEELTTFGGWAILGHSHCTTQAMSEEQLKAFLEAVKADAGLQEKLNAAANSDAVVAIAKAAGFVISAEEFQRAQAEISEQELEGVAGGKRRPLQTIDPLIDEFICVAG